MSWESLNPLPPRGGRPTAGYYAFFEYLLKSTPSSRRETIRHCYESITHQLKSTPSSRRETDQCSRVRPRFPA